MNKNDITHFLSSNRKMLFILCSVFAIGIILGTLCVKTLSDIQKVELINYLSNFFKIIENGQTINKNEVFIDLLVNNLKLYGVILLLGLFTMGIFLIPIIVLAKGFILGFTIGFILDELYLMGLLFSLFVIFPQNVLYIAGLVISSLISMLMSYRIFMSRRKLMSRFYYRKNITQMVYYFLTVSVGYLITVMGCVFEAYITPVFMIFFSNKLF